MQKYRSVLYENYTAAFDEIKHVSDEVKWRSYELTYDVSTLSPDLKIADIGCGRGEWLGWLESKGFHNLTGFDYTDELNQREFAQASCELIQGDVLEQLTNYDQTFDLLTCHDLIEHLTKDETVMFFAAAKKALKPGGQLWVSTFNAQAAGNLHLYFGDFTHETAFTPISMYQVMKCCEFQDVTVVTVETVKVRNLGSFLRAVSQRLINAVAAWIIHARVGKDGHRPGKDFQGVKSRLIAKAYAPKS